MKLFRFAVWVSLLSLVLAMLACNVAPQAPFARPTATQPARSRDILPTRVSASDSTAVPRLSAGAQPSPEMANTPLAPATPTPSAGSVPPPPTSDPKQIILTEDDISQAVGRGVGEDQGLKVQGVKVRFADDKMTLSADELALGPLQVRNLEMIGSLYAQDGRLAFETESVSPRGLVTNMLPAIANQILSEYASRWYVEDVRIRDGRMELRIR